MDPHDIGENIDTLLESGVNPNELFDHLGPNVFWNHNIAKLLDAGLDPLKTLDTLGKAGDVMSSSTIAQNLDAFIQSGVGAGILAGRLESGWLSMCFDKLYAAGLDLSTVDKLVSEGKLKTEDVEKRRNERSRFTQEDESFGVDSVLDLSTGKMKAATRAPEDIAA